jgi:hypothetical protein
MTHTLRRSLAAGVLLLAAAYAYAAEAVESIRDPLNYSLKHYSFIVGTALLGGVVSWYTKVRRGEIGAFSVMHLIGELATSAFAGLLCFWIMESLHSPALVTASMVGIAGHAGARAISGFEQWAQRRWGSTAGRDERP